MSNFDLDLLDISKKAFHKRHAKISFEEKVLEVIELQKLDMELRKEKYEREKSYKRVWVIDEIKKIY